MTMNHGPQHPHFRATLSRGRLYVVPWGPWLAHGGPMGCLARQAIRSTAVADLLVTEESRARGLVVTLVTGSVAALRDPLTDWATALGYSRLWLPDDVLELGLPLGPREYGTRCPTCEAEWSDDGADFWQHAVAAGSFPSYCWVCGGLMAQWEPWSGTEVVA